MDTLGGAACSCHLKKGGNFVVGKGERDRGNRVELNSCNKATYVVVQKWSYRAKVHKREGKNNQATKSTGSTYSA